MGTAGARRVFCARTCSATPYSCSACSSFPLRTAPSASPLRRAALLVPTGGGTPALTTFGSFALLLAADSPVDPDSVASALASTTAASLPCGCAAGAMAGSGDAGGASGKGCRSTPSATARRAISSREASTEGCAGRSLSAARRSLAASWSCERAARAAPRLSSNAKRTRSAWCDRQTSAARTSSGSGEGGKSPDIMDRSTPSLAASASSSARPAVASAAAAEGS
mmetsp:Transcript_31921/g.105706  ORF Transcript_31921/g.105706 Transcript_31921/m.105706 type:complete len:225 (-) Transcript_31921:1589-2263(-)